MFSALNSRSRMFRESRIKKLNFTCHFIACGLLLLPSELLDVIRCKIANSSMKFKFIHKISVIRETFLVYFNLPHGPNRTPCDMLIQPCVTYSRMLLIAGYYLQSYITYSQDWCHLWPGVTYNLVVYRTLTGCEPQDIQNDTISLELDAN